VVEYPNIPIESPRNHPLNYQITIKLPLNHHWITIFLAKLLPAQPCHDTITKFTKCPRLRAGQRSRARREASAGQKPGATEGLERCLCNQAPGLEHGGKMWGFHIFRIFLGVLVWLIVVSSENGWQNVGRIKFEAMELPRVWWVFSENLGTSLKHIPWLSKHNFPVKVAICGNHFPSPICFFLATHMVVQIKMIKGKSYEVRPPNNSGSVGLVHSKNQDLWQSYNSYS